MLTRRGRVVGIAAMLAWMWLGSAIGTWITGESGDAYDTPPTSATVTGEGTRAAERPPSPRASRAARSRPVDVGRERATTLDWTALARCESTNNPQAVSPSGKYRGLYQADADFWRTYGGLAYAPRPDLATAAEQTAVAARGYAARGRSPWPICGRLL